MRTPTPVSSSAGSIRILHVLRSIDPADGDLSRVAVQIAADQASAGHHVTLVTMDTAEVMVRAQQEFGVLPGYDRLHIYHSHDRASLAYILGSNAMQWLRPMLSKAGVIHVHGMWEALLHRAASLGRRKGIPVVATPHASRPAPAPGWLGGPLRAMLQRGWSGMLREADMVHAMDGEEVRHLHRLGIRENVRCIPVDATLGRRVTQEYPFAAAAAAS